MSLRILVCSLLLIAISAKHYSLDIDFQVSEVSDEVASLFYHANDRVVAMSSFTDDRNASGWSYYEIQTKASYPDWLQTYSAGYMEGYLAYDLIWDAYSNFQSQLENGIPDDVAQYIHNQTTWMVKMVLGNPKDNYWNLVNATLAQLAGMYEGYLTAITKHSRLDLKLTFNQFYEITYTSDFWDVMGKFNGKSQKPLSCSFLLKMTQDNLFASHTTWYGYFWLLKTYKVLNLNLNNPLAKTKRISYSAQPGSVASQDDFYILDNNHFVSETSIANSNPDVYGFLHYETVPYWVRVTVANLAFDTMQNWVDTFFSYRSGTYNNQWILIDFNNYNASKDNLSQAKDIVWFAEELYGMTSVEDVTQALLIPQGYVASYNVPYNATLQAYSQDATNYTTDPRAILFAKYAPGIQNIDDFKQVMRLNNHSDTGDYCQAIAARCDLEDPTAFPNGAIDCKVTSDSLITTQQAWIIVGPTSENLPPFTWADYPQFSDARNGLETVWDFDWVLLDPNSNFTQMHQHEEFIMDIIS